MAHHLHIDPLVVVSVADPALDLDAMISDKSINAYRDHRDPALIREHPGGRCVRFTLGLPPHSIAYSYVLRGDSHEEQLVRAFAVGVGKIENYRFTPDGPFEGRGPGSKIRGANGEWPCWTEEDLDRIRLPGTYVLEIGAIAFARFFRPPGSALPLPLPHTCAAEHLLRVRHLVASRRRDATETTTSASPSTEITAIEPASELATAATATG